ncbi:MAG TPA: hypothetical protein ACFYD2_09645, partial [Candidatus Avalokitesvara rifleensis]|uniref:hypothetical protein n=1 Tax=Candidatus Avalokitesvara rifleensis TaxID=3367620 RepID=UPI00402528DE
MLVFFGINIHSSSASTVKENRVRQEIKEARQLVTRLERESEQAHQESDGAQTNLQEVLRNLDIAQSREEAAAREQAAVWRSIQEGTQWIDDEISKRKADIKIARIMGNQEEITHLEREIAAYEKQKQKALSEPTVQLQRLKEEGLNAALQRGEAENLVYERKITADAAEKK